MELYTFNVVFFVIKFTNLISAFK